MKKSKKDKYNKASLLLKFSVMILVIVVLFSISIFVADSVNRREQLKDDENLLFLLASQIEPEYLVVHRALEGVASLKVAQETISGDKSPDNEEVLSVLHAARYASKVGLVYLMDSTGTTVACTPYGKDYSSSLTGHNYSFRPYFKNVMETGKPQLYNALGVTTDERGFYMGLPIYTEGNSDNPSGVAVAKIPLNEVDRILKDNCCSKLNDPSHQHKPESSNCICMLLSEDGIVFASSRPAWNFRSALPITEKRKKELIESRQYGNKPLSPLNFTADISKIELSERTFNVMRRPVLWEGWSLILLSAVRPLDKMLIFKVFMLLFIFAFSLNAAVFYFLRQRRSIVHILKQDEVLKHKQSELKLLLDNIDAGVMVINPEDHIIQFINPAAARMIGIEVDNAVGRMCHQFLCPQEKGQCPITDLHQVVDNSERVMLRADGSEILVLKSVRKVHLNGAERLLETFVDITESKKLEEEREQLTEQLLQAQKMESIGRLAGGVAHDFNNMLSIIIGHVEMAQMIESYSPVELNAIKNAAERSASLTRQLLTFARKQIIIPKIIDLNDIVDNLLKMIKKLIGENIALTWKRSEESLFVKIDITQIEQILTNLCINARDAIGRNGSIVIKTSKLKIDTSTDVKGAISITGYKKLEPGEYAVITVSDTGCGIDPESIEHIFEPFFTTKGIGEGTGLGLSTVFGIVDQNKGYINVQSDKGVGTEFQIFLPIVEQESSNLEEKLDSNKEKNAFGKDTDTILLVEDEPALAQMISMMLEKHGFSVLHASSPEDALTLAEQHHDHIHLLLTDIVMPETNGYELSEHITKLYPGMHCLFMSGYTSDVLIKQGVNQDDVEFIQKPFAMGDLIDRINRMLD